MKYIFLLALMGCGDKEPNASAIGGMPSDSPRLQGCLTLSPTLVDFEALHLDELPASVDLEVEDECGFLSDVQWTLDDPDDVFSASWTSDESVTVTLNTALIGSWEAQYIGKLDASNSIRVQIFADTIESQ